MMRKRQSEAIAAAAAVAAMAMAGPGSASAATTRICPNNYVLTSTALAWYLPLNDLNGDGYVCLKSDKSGVLVAIADNTVR